MVQRHVLPRGGRCACSGVARTRWGVAGPALGQLGHRARSVCCLLGYRSSFAGRSRALRKCMRCPPAQPVWHNCATDAARTRARVPSAARCSRCWIQSVQRHGEWCSRAVLTSGAPGAMCASADIATVGRCRQRSCGCRVRVSFSVLCGLVRCACDSGQQRLQPCKSLKRLLSLELSRRARLPIVVVLSCRVSVAVRHEIGSSQLSSVRVSVVT